MLASPVAAWAVALWAACHPGGSHTITCRASNGDEGGFFSYVRSGSSNTSAVCYYGFPGHSAWVTVDGVRSNTVAW